MLLLLRAEKEVSEKQENNGAGYKWEEGRLAHRSGGRRRGELGKGSRSVGLLLA